MTREVETSPPAAPAAATAAPGCPRCGYDLRGIVAAWRETCPLQGTCAECGLEFGWDELLRSDRLLPRWCIEFAGSRPLTSSTHSARRGALRRVPILGIGLTLVGATIRTWLRSFWPFGFWKRMKMSFPIRWGRLAVYLALLVLLPAMTLYVGGRAGLAVYVRWQWEQAFERMPAYVTSSMRIERSRPFRSPYYSPAAVLPSLVIDEKFWFEQQKKQTLAEWQMYLDSPPWIDHSYAAAIYEAVFLPLAEESIGRYDSSGIAYVGLPWQPYPTGPAELLNDAFSQPWTGGGGYGGEYFLEQLFQAAGAVLVCTELLVLFPLSLALLPVTRKRAKVRWAHIGRVAVYSAFVPATALIAAIVLMTADQLAAFTGLSERDLALVAPLALVPLLGGLWWWAAIKHYLKLPHALAVTLLLGVLCLLVGMMGTAILAEALGL